MLINLPERVEYGIDYMETAFGIWITSNKPSMEALVTLIPEHPELNRKPSAGTLKYWKTNGRWQERADDIDAKIQENTDRHLVQVRMEMMERHARMSAEIADRAFEHLMGEDGFDSSASAVNALFKALETEKASRGLAGALTKVFALSDDDLKKEMDKLLSKVTDVGGDEDILEGEEVPEYGYAEAEENVTGREETPDPDDRGDAE